MNEIEKIEKINKKILDLAVECKSVIGHKKVFTEKEKVMKKQIRALLLTISEGYQMIEMKNNDVYLRIKFPRSFDKEKFKAENPGLVQRYFKTEMKTITTTTEIFKEKKLESDYPDIYQEYRKALTPSLTIK